MSKPLLTMILIVDTEKDAELTRLFFYGLATWNRRAMDRVQVIVVTQKERDPHTHRVAARQPFPVSVIHARHETVGGYPLWDVCEEARMVWPMVQGEYVTFSHQEFLWCPDRLAKTLDYLEEECPVVALGNLRRPGELGEPKKLVRDDGKEYCDEIQRHVKAGDSYLAAAIAESMPSRNWMCEESVEPGPSPWMEDVFFVRKAWLEATEFFTHADRCVFQDIYDLMGAAMYRLGSYGLAPSCVRMTMDVHKAIHMHHPRLWNSFTPEIRDHFLSNPERWDGTSYMRPDLWKMLIELGQGRSNRNPVSIVRTGRGGTVSRFSRSVEEWVTNGGTKRLVDYYRTVHGETK